jgi:hypothetical protein
MDSLTDGEPNLSPISESLKNAFFPDCNLNKPRLQRPYASEQSAEEPCTTLDAAYRVAGMSNANSAGGIERISRAP